LIKKVTAASLLAVLILVSCAGVSAIGGIPTSMSVDFDETTTDLSLGQGESGVLTLVVTNTGGQSAENVRVTAYATGGVLISKEFQLGTVVAGESKTLPISVSATGERVAGIINMRVTIYYDGYDSDGDEDDDQYSNWEVPIRINTDPGFQITPSKTTYYEGALEELDLDVMAESKVNDLRAELSSDCLVVIGSSSFYVGDMMADSKSKITYMIKPTDSGACQTTLELSYKDRFGTSSTTEIPIGLSVGDSGVNFQIVSVGGDALSPGDTAKIKVALKNIGSVTAEKTTMSLNLEDPFVPMDGIEYYADSVNPGDTVEAEFSAYISWDAEATTYSLPLNIEYTLGGTSYSQEKSIGLDVSGEVILEIISVESSGSSIAVKVANIGTRDAESVKATLTTGGGASRAAGTGMAGSSSGSMPTATGGTPQATANAGSQSVMEYKSSIKATKESTFTFSVSSAGSATLTLEYTGVNNERVTQVEELVFSSSSGTASAGGFAGRSRSNGSLIESIGYPIALLVLAYLGYRYYKRRKKGLVVSKGIKNLFGFI